MSAVLDIFHQLLSLSWFELAHAITLQLGQRPLSLSLSLTSHFSLQLILTFLSSSALLLRGKFSEMSHKPALPSFPDSVTCVVAVVCFRISITYFVTQHAAAVVCIICKILHNMHIIFWADCYRAPYLKERDYQLNTCTAHTIWAGQCNWYLTR